MKNIRRSWTWAVVAMMAFTGPVAVAAQHRHETTLLSVGQKGEVTLTTETKVADITLKPGRYYLDHRVAGTVAPRRVEGHYIHFTELTPALNQRREGARTFGDANVAHPGEIECTLEALPKKASKTQVFTTMEDGIARITRIEIAGESVAHLF